MIKVDKPWRGAMFNSYYSYCINSKWNKDVHAKNEPYPTRNDRRIVV